MNQKEQDRELGMHQQITRRDFLNGVSIAVGASMLAGNPLWAEAFGIPQSPFVPEKDPTYYPPAKTGMRGSHDGSWEVAHALRDGKDWPDSVADAEAYDLIVVGAGISGLAAAYFYRKAAVADARILLLDNHDDFGGHAKRNEFQAGNRLLLGYGGTQSIEAPAHYSKEAIGLLKELGIEVQRFYKYYDQEAVRVDETGRGHFLRQRNFWRRSTRGRSGPALFRSDVHARDRYSATHRRGGTARHPSSSGNQSRLSARPHSGTETLQADQDELQRFPTELREGASRCRQGFPESATRFVRRWDDAVSAYDCARYSYPGFRGITLPKRHREDDQEEEEPYIFHFPDGNASIARMLVRSLVPGVSPAAPWKTSSPHGRTMVALTILPRAFVCD